MITSGQVAIGTVASAIDGVSTNPTRITISNVDNTDAVYLGGSAVTTSDGFGLQKLEMIQFDLAPLEQLYAVSGKAGHTISWLRQTI
jgi:hypothetical protein